MENIRKNSFDEMKGAGRSATDLNGVQGDVHRRKQAADSVRKYLRE